MVGSALVTYTYFGPGFAHGGPQPSINIGVIHDIEAPIKTGEARSLCGPDYFGHGGDPGHPVSIHYVVGPDDTCQGCDEATVAWHVGIGNSGTIGIEQLGFAAFDRSTWLAQGEVQFARLAQLMADISARHPLIRPQWLTDGELVHAWNNKTTPGGWATHKQMSRCGIGSDHHDPDDGWPADYVMGLVNGGTVPTPVPVPPPVPTPEDDHMYTAVKAEDSDGIWLGAPGYWELFDNPEQVNVLVKAKICGPVVILTHREMDVIRDWFKNAEGHNSAAVSGPHEQDAPPKF